MCMEIALMNRQDVAEPDLAASGVAGTGQENGRKTGIVEQGMMGAAGKFSRHAGCTGTLPVQKIPGEFFAPQIPAQVSGTPKNSPGSMPEVSPALREKTGKKNRIVLGMGVLYNGGTLPPAPGAVPASTPGTGLLRDRTTAPEDPGPDPCESIGHFLFTCYERQERIYGRINRKIERLDQKVKKLEVRRMQKRDERRS
jgi:hypothetical protein